MSGVTVSVGYADTARPNPKTPAPWKGSPSTVFIGTPAGPYDGGAMRLDNTTNHAVLIRDVKVVLPRAHGQSKTFELWGAFTIPAHWMAILAQTEGHQAPQWYVTNFDTSDYPLHQITSCASAIPAGPFDHPARITVSLVSASGKFSQKTLFDTGHVLDTGGYDSVKCGNESLGWRIVGTVGVRNASEFVHLRSSSLKATIGDTENLTATVTDASAQPLPNVAVNFRVLHGPDSGRLWSSTTNASGEASITYTSAHAGFDVVRAEVPNASGGTLKSNKIIVWWLAPNVMLTPSQGKPGSNVTISGTGFKANETITVKLNCAVAACGGFKVAVLGTAVADQQGSFSLAALIPTSTSLGFHRIGARGASGRFAAHIFVVTLK